MAKAAAYCSLVDGSLVREGTAFAVTNPATRGVAGTAIVPSIRTLNQAIRAGNKAFAQWRNEQWTVRSSLLLALADVVCSNADELSRLLTLEQGKPYQQAKEEIELCILDLEHCAKQQLSPLVLSRDEGAHVEQFFVPFGVVAGIVPWNFPLFTAISKVAPALVVGNAIIVKCAPTTPLATLRFAELVKDIVPAGLVQILADDGTLGPKLVRHPGIAKVSFTGSTVTGKAVMKSAAQSLKRLTLELGGNDPAIVFEDVDPDAVAESIFRIAFLNCGQVCTAIKRVYAASAIHKRVCEKLANLAREAVVGDGLDQRVTIGPLQNKMQFEKVRRYLEEAGKNGRILAGGEETKLEGYFIRPTIVTDIADDAGLVQDEQFGPILPILQFDDENDVIRRANDTRYGLSASVWSADLKRAQRVARSLDFGTVWINKHLDLNLDYPMSACKESGIGAEFGYDGLREYAQARLMNQ